jgi:hypothetical protein
MKAYPVRPNRFSQPFSPHSVHLNHPNHHPFTNFDRSGALQPRFRRFQKQWKANWKRKKNKGFYNKNLNNKNQKNYWQKGESSHQVNEEIH